MQRLLDELSIRLTALREAADAAVELSDRVPDLAPGMSMDEMSALALILKDTRDAVSKAKTRCTFARDKLDEFFARKIAFEYGDTCYRTEDATFIVTAAGFYSGPSPHKDPDGFAGLISWIASKGGDPWKVLHGKVGFQTFCDEQLEKGEALPGFVKEHTNARVQIRRKT